MRERLDVLLTRRGLAPSRERARALVMEGRVRVGGQVVTKPGTRLAAEVGIEVRGGDGPVGRGYHKLEGALEALGLEVDGRVCLDAGASTGGFTELLLARGATRVYALDVGYGQLAWSLRQDSRVVVMERTNLRRVEPARFVPRPERLVMDLSFISVLKVLESLERVLTPGAEGLVLVKPQFEAGPARVGKGGVVRDPAVHMDVLEEVCRGAADRGWGCRGVCPSPIRGAKGNREFFLALTAPDAGPPERLAPGALDAALREEPPAAGG